MPRTVSDISAPSAIFDQHELAHMQSVIDAVCFELGVSAQESRRREAIAERVMGAYRRGSRLPLNMVSAALSEHAGGCQA